MRSFAKILMKFLKKKIENLYLIKTNTFSDIRGTFRRGFCENTLLKKKIKFKCVQTNISENLKRGTLRGFHYNKNLRKEPKIITCLRGEIFLSVVDLRKKSNSIIDVINIKLNSKNKNLVYVPAGCASAFLTLKNNSIVYYLMGNYYEKKNDKGFLFNSKRLKINWPIKPKIISKKDLALPEFDKRKG